MTSLFGHARTTYSMLQFYSLTAIENFQNSGSKTMMDICIQRHRSADHNSNLHSQSASFKINQSYVFSCIPTMIAPTHSYSRLHTLTFDFSAITNIRSVFTPAAVKRKQLQEPANTGISVTPLHSDADAFIREEAHATILSATMA